MICRDMVRPLKYPLQNRIVELITIARSVSLTCKGKLPLNGGGSNDSFLQDVLCEICRYTRV